MIAALIINHRADEITLDESLRRASTLGLVPCVPKNFCAAREFTVTFFNPKSIPARWRRLLVCVKPAAAAQRISCGDAS
jgi:hypothetical protein